MSSSRLLSLSREKHRLGVKTSHTRTEPLHTASAMFVAIWQADRGWRCACCLQTATRTSVMLLMQTPSNHKQDSLHVHDGPRDSLHVHDGPRVTFAALGNASSLMRTRYSAMGVPSAFDNTHIHAVLPRPDPLFKHIERDVQANKRFSRGRR